MAEMVMKRERWPGGYKVQATPLVYPGQEVVPDQPVLRLKHLKQVERVLPADQRLSLPSFISGEWINAHNNDPEIVPAGLYGRVVDITPRGGVVIESRATFVSGAIGAGRQVAGVLTLWQAGREEQDAQIIPPGAILIVPGPLNFTLLYQALHSGVVGIVASSISLRDFEGFLRTDLLQLLNQRNSERTQEHLPPITLLLTEGLGLFAMPAHTLKLLSQHKGSIALLSGTTSVSSNIFPELVISHPGGDETLADWPSAELTKDLSLLPGVYVRICAGEYEGAIGVITHLYIHQQTFPSGIRARAARLCLDYGPFLTVPLALLEPIS